MVRKTVFLTLVLLVYPAVYILWKERELPGTAAPSPA